MMSHEPASNPSEGMTDERTTSDALWAFAIGVLLGVGTALVVGSDDEEEEIPLLAQLRERGLDAHVARGRQRRELDDAVAIARRIARRRG